MKTYKITGIVICSVTLCALSLIWFFPKTEANLGPPLNAEKTTGRLAQESKAVSEPSVFAGEEILEGTDIYDPESDEELNQEIVVARLHELFEKRIYHPRIQLQAIEKLMRYLQDIYPEEWQDHVFDYLSAAFPEYAEELYDHYLKFVEFKQWIKDNYMLISGMNAVEQKEYMRAKRKQFFGDEAEVIWEMEIKAECVADSLKAINGQKEMVFDDKINYYLATLDDVYGNQAEFHKKSYQQKIMDQFLEVESVQEDLQQMAPEERKENLENFRKTMGLDDAALNRWAELDGVRDERWENGQAYMRKREAIRNESNGPTLEYRLDDLRKEYFGAEAEAIKQEEETGLFRFNRKRVYGKN